MNISKVLGQISPSANTLTPVYTAPDGFIVDILNMAVANRSSNPTAFRITVQPKGIAATDKHYIYYDIPLPGNDTFATALRITLEPGDTISAYVGNSTVSITLFGQKTKL